MDTALSASILCLFIYVIASTLGRNQREARQAARLARLERKVDAIVKHMGVNVADAVNPTVLELAVGGKKIQAIKAYRELTGVGLKEAKDYVESL